MYKKAILNKLVKTAGILSDLAKGTVNGTKGITNAVIIPATDNTESFAERLGYNIGELTGKPEDDNGELGPYKNVVKHLKDTELAEAYLRAAAAMRRKARILRRRREEEEGLRNSIARSRFF